MKAFAFAFIAVLAMAHADLAEARRGPQPAGECPRTNGDTPVYLMDVTQRNVFYECNSGKAVPMRCPRGLVFNPKLNVCDFPCQDCPAYGPVGQCPRRDGLFLYYLRDGANVSVFYVCWEGEAVKYTCDDGLVFSPVYKACFSELWI